MNFKQWRRCMLVRFGLILSLLALLTSGCVTDLGYLTDPGKAYKPGLATQNLFDQQVITWAAPLDPSPVQGMPGFISEGIFTQRYLEEIVESEDDKKNEQEDE